jgi:L-ascorbate metabolism protein UlaG (beta-lactamase superfamily)
MIWSYTVISVVSVLAIALFVVDNLLSAPKYDANTSNHFDGSKFINPGNAGTHQYWEVLKWWLSGNDKGHWIKVQNSTTSEFSVPAKEVSKSDFRVTFINHATFLLQIDGLNILTDPIWSYRASPYQWIGPKRMREPGIAFENLPAIDAVLISHNHYDHLDIRTVERLHHQYNPQFIVPLGVKKLLHDHGITQTTDLDWWEAHNLSENLSLTAVPAQHFSGRGLFDRNKTLWCGYVLHSSHGNIYFAGDTGYGDFIQKISNRFAPIHTSLLPIGAYKPRWFMKPIHMSPEEAVMAHNHLQSRQSIGMHFGTFPMADDGMREPMEDLQNARKQHHISSNQFFVLREGETKKLHLPISANAV